MEQSYDYIVIGSGFGGSVAALRLAEKGYSVLVIEKGKRYGTNDFPKTNWNLKKYLWAPGLRLFGIQQLSFHREATILTGVGVGGGSLVYANTLVIPPDEFFNNSSWNTSNNWKKSLEPYYKKAGFMLGRTRYEKFNLEDQILNDVAKELSCGETFDMVDVGVYFGDREVETDPYFNGLGPKRKGCTECAGCMVGCRDNAKNTLDKNYLYFAEMLGVDILPETHAEKIQYSEEIYTVYTHSSTKLFRGSSNTFNARGLIIAGGSLGTLDLLLKQKFKYKSLPVLSNRLGEELRTNSQTLCAVSGAKEKLNNGVSISSIINPDSDTHIEIVKYPDGSNAMKWFFALSVPGARNSLIRSFLLIGKTFIHPLHFLKTVFNFRWSTNLVIFLVMQTVDNCMKAEWKKKFFGSGLKIKNTGDKKVPAYIDVGQQVMEKYAEKAGGIAQNITLEVFLNRPTTAHILGGCPMGNSLVSGVVNERFEVHGYPNMFIMDGSIIQGNLGVNPSFTITALAEYAMDFIPDKPGNKTKSIKEKMMELNTN